MPPSDHPAPDAEERLPRHTTPTWEVELLISGVAVFAMLQLPGWLNERLLFLLPRFDENWRSVLAALFAYLVGAAVILAATFALHLLLRACWIALVGMHSVYPDGIRWERLRMGPIEREVIRHRDGDFSTVIDRADNRASVVFAMGVALAVSLLVFTTLMIIVFAALWAIVLTLHLPIRVSTIVIVCVLIVLVPMVLLRLLDHRLGSRLPEGGRMRRAVVAMFNVYARLGFANRGGVLAMLSSHHGRRRVQAVAGVAIMMCIVGASFGRMAARHPELFGSYAWFPQFDRAGANVIDTSHYDDQRDPSRSPLAAFIQSVEIDGNYVKLMVPYQPDRDAAAMRRTCPAAPAIADDDARAAAMLRCLAALHTVILDGKPLADLHYNAGSDARTDRPSLVAMIDVRALNPGRHELVIARTPSSGDGGTAPPDPWIIPFWR